jgi:dTDP-4-amino-4,6-dideoxygalactose transaminase
MMVRHEVPPVKLYFPPQDIEQIKSDVGKILKSGMLTLGEYTRRFEAEWAETIGTKYSVGVNSGTAALEIALRASNVKQGDEVIVPTNTFSATAATVILTGAKPILTDVDPESVCIDSENVENHITNRTKAVMAVDIGGLVCPDIKAIRETCKDHRLLLIEDAAHAHGSTIDGEHAGSLGDIGCFSFYPTKVMTTGEGGMVTTNNNSVADQAKIMRDQGKENFNSSVIIELGYNWRMQEISAAVGLAQLSRLHEIIEERNKIAKFFDKKLSQLDRLRPLKVPANIKHNYYKYIAFLDSDINREDFKQKLKERGVRLSGEVYWPPLHLQPLYQRLLGTKKGDFPAAEDSTSRMVCLPIYAQMTMDEAQYVIDMINEELDNL